MGEKEREEVAEILCYITDWSCF